MAGLIAEGKAVYLRCQESWDAVGLGEFHCVDMAMSNTDGASDMEDARRLGRRGELAMAEVEAASILEYEWPWVTDVAERLLARDTGIMTGDEVAASRPSTYPPYDRQ